jgi:hypothetical protein
MRVIFLRKKLELLAKPETGGDVVVYHGTNLANLYLIARSRFLGSSVGFHTGSLERVGRFYVATSELISFNRVALGYARYMWPPTRPKVVDYSLLPKIQRLRLSEITYDRIAEATGINDVYDLYLTMWALAGGPENYVPDAAPVVLEITIDSDLLYHDAYIDEDHFYGWVIWKADDETLNKIMGVVLQDSEFRLWVKQVTGMSDEEVDMKTNSALLYDLVKKEEEEGVLRKVYNVLINLAESGNGEAIEILRSLARYALAPERRRSFFFARALSFDEVKKLTAHVYTEWGEHIEIDLKDEGALGKIEEILKRAIEWYAGKIQRRGSPALRKNLWGLVSKIYDGGVCHVRCSGSYKGD